MDGCDELYKEVRETYQAALQRLARGYEADPERRADLLQEIHIELWRSFKIFENKCTLRTWVYRVAHNVASSRVVSSRRSAAQLVELDALEAEPGFVDGERQANQKYSVSRLLDRIYRLKPLDRQTILLYLEGEDAASISDITGLSAGNIAVKIHRIKKLLNREAGEGANGAE